MRGHLLKDGRAHASYSARCSFGAWATKTAMSAWCRTCEETLPISAPTRPTPRAPRMIAS